MSAGLGQIWTRVRVLDSGREEKKGRTRNGLATPSSRWACAIAESDSSAPATV